MRRYLLIILLTIMTLLTLLIIAFGIHIGGFRIYSYKKIKNSCLEKNNVLNDLYRTNNVEFQEKTELLTQTVKEYKVQKTKYEELVAAGEISNNAQYNSMDLYDIDYLWTIIGNYATKQGITLQFDVTKSDSATAISSEYVMCDLAFTVTGDYIAITDFIYSIENDDKLNFEIRDFVMEKGGTNLQATFNVKAVPINSSNLSSVPTTVTSITNGTIESN